MKRIDLIKKELQEGLENCETCAFEVDKPHRGHIMFCMKNKFILSVVKNDKVGLCLKIGKIEKDYKG